MVIGLYGSHGQNAQDHAISAEEREGEAVQIRHQRIMVFTAWGQGFKKISVTRRLVPVIHLFGRTCFPDYNTIRYFVTNILPSVHLI